MNAHPAPTAAARPIPAEVRFAIQDLYTRCAAALDSQRYADWPDHFTEDAVYRMVPRENYDQGLPIAIIHCDGKGMIRDRAFTASETTIAQPRWLRHFISGIAVCEADGGYDAQADVLVVQTMQDRLTEIVMAGRYLDRVVLEEGRFLFAQRLCVADTLLYPASVVAPV